MTGFSCFNITQNNTSVFRNLYMHETLLVMIQKGSKRVNPDSSDFFEANPGELLIFPSGQFITIENRIMLGTDYSAIGISYSNDIVNDIFDPSLSQNLPRIVHIKSCPRGLSDSIKALKQIYSSSNMPEHIVKHRFIEPLIWLKSMGHVFPAIQQKDIECKIRDLIISDTSKHWRSEEVAAIFSMSEATMRRRLRKRKTNLTAIIQNVRLEKGLAILQTTTKPITEIAYDCGFSSPSHFSQVFKDRFNIRPSDIRL